MTSNIMFFLSAFLLSLPVWLGFNTSSNALSEALFWKEMTENPAVLQAQLISARLQEQVREERPTLKPEAILPDIQAEQAFSLFLDEKGNTKTLFGETNEQRRPIASLTKLMTALVVAKHYDPAQQIVISSSAVAEEENLGQLRVGDVFPVQDLLYPLLMESSNDAAAAFAEVLGRQVFVDVMNLEAQALGLLDTHFVNPTGLDPDDPQGPINYSTGKDLSQLASYIVQTYPRIFDILAVSQQDLLQKGTFHHTMKNTNELLSFDGWPTLVVGGKTGWTPLAKGNLVLVLEGPKNRGYLVNVILGADDRFSQMKTLVNWVYDSFVW
jgi:serine-type D-Ala-D-Ala carboxypeptidase (penicillin-binding protein 5/6)